MAAAGVETIVGIFQLVAPRNYGRKTAQQLIDLAQHSTSSGMAISARTRSLKVLCDQLEHTQTNLTQLEEEIDHLLTSDSGAKGVRSVPECGRKMVAVLRAELGDVTRFERADQVVAYAGLDIEVRQSGKWRGEAKRVFAREWAAASALVYDGSTLYPAQALSFWHILPSPPGPWNETPCCPGGRDAQDAAGSLPTVEDPREL
jgi:Transposase IS116/IS110/IS902 family